MLSIITLNESDKWNEIVKSFKQVDAYYLGHYTNAFKLNGDGEPHLFYFEDLNIRAINVVMKRDIEQDTHFKGKIPPNTFYDLSTPYGYGGFLIEGNITEASLDALNVEYQSFCQKEGIISEFVRFHPVLNNDHHVDRMYDITKRGKTITMSLTSQGHIWANLNSNKKRWIKKAIQSGVEIYWGRNPELFDQFMTMYSKTMDKNDARDYYYFNRDFFKSILHDMKLNAMIFYAVYEEKNIGMVLVLHCNGQLHHHFSASNSDYKHLAVTNLLMYEIACWGSVNGYKTFHLGGGVGSKEDALYRFKEGFNKNSNTIFSIGKKVFNEKIYKELIEIRKFETSFNESNTFFPLYRIE